MDSPMVASLAAILPRLGLHAATGNLLPEWSGEAARSGWL